MRRSARRSTRRRSRSSLFGLMVEPGKTLPERRITRITRNPFFKERCPLPCNNNFQSRLLTAVLSSQQVFGRRLQIPHVVFMNAPIRVHVSTHRSWIIDSWVSSGNDRQIVIDVALTEQMHEAHIWVKANIAVVVAWTRRPATFPLSIAEIVDDWNETSCRVERRCPRGARPRDRRRRRTCRVAREAPATRGRRR